VQLAPADVAAATKPYRDAVIVTLKAAGGGAVVAGAVGAAVGVMVAGGSVADPFASA
jgi:hypothetical protein